MYRPPHPGMVNYSFRNHTSYNNQWRPNHMPFAPAQNQWRRRGPTSYGAPVMENQNNYDHWCETCDRDFPTLDILEKHKQQHQKCNIDGCQFVAHPKVITKHIQMQHSTGLYKRICKLNNPEEIQKWREERKKKYPTKSNIEKKAAEYREKIERGEKMALRYQNGNMHRSEGTNIGMKRKHGFDKGQQNQRQMRTNFKQNNSIKSTNPPPKKVPKTLPTVVEKNKLQPFAGIMGIMVDEKEEEVEVDQNQVIEDDDEVIASKDIPIQKDPAICGALSSLMCDYGSSDEEAVITDKNKLVNTNDHTKLSIEAKNIDVNMIKQHAAVNSISEEVSKEEKIDNTNINFPQESVNLIKEKTRSDVGKIDNTNINLLLESVNTTNEQIKSDVGKIDNTNNNLLQQPESSINEHNKSDDDSGPEETTIIKRDEKENEIKIDNKIKLKPIVPIHKNNVNRNRQRQNYKPRPKIPSTLLYKLLSKEIRHERNVVLQCIRYIIKNNYFDK